MNETLTRRCNVVVDLIRSLPTAKITQSCKDRLLKLVQAELNFLSRSTILSGPISTNIGYVEAIVNVVLQPGINGVSCVCKTIQGPLQGRSFNVDFRGTHVDIVCTYNRKPTWFVVSDRNPKYISWSNKCSRKGLKTRLDFLLEAALSSVILQPVSIILCFANGIENVIAQRLKEDYSAVQISDFKQNIVEKKNVTKEYLGRPGTCYFSDIFQDVEGGEWVNVLDMKEKCIEDSRSDASNGNQVWMAFEIKVKEKNLGSGYVQCQIDRVNMVDKSCPENDFAQEEKHMDRLEEKLLSENVGLLKECIPQLDKKFLSILVSMDLSSDLLVNGKETTILKDNLINLDTTALVALVSELSNGCAKKLVEMSVEDMNRRFKSTTSFMRDQAKSEIRNPILEDMASILGGKRAIISQYVDDEFRDLISMCSGPNEKLRAECLLKCILVLPDNPSARVMGLPETGKIKLKHKVIFGTGDLLHAPTLTANMGFVRAVRQTGMPLLVLEHRPRALVGC
ncbi:hypothetical protein SUGI_0716480 [Cryptomeria japonica]|nr:hypothetical protein SUGI_0716480 [Cryptomeria japonica]